MVGGACLCCGLGLTGCAATNPIREMSLDASGAFRLEDARELAKPGGSVKVRVGDGRVIVWRRSETELGAASIVCTHFGSEVAYNHAAGRLDCPSHGSRFALDGSVVNGPARQPLETYRVEVSGGVVKVTR